MHYILLYVHFLFIENELLKTTNILLQFMQANYVYCIYNTLLTIPLQSTQHRFIWEMPSFVDKLCQLRYPKIIITSRPPAEHYNNKN
jgi:hypothetical protein